jgi:hypothetical protein
MKCGAATNRGLTSGGRPAHRATSPALTESFALVCPEEPGGRVKSAATVSMRTAPVMVATGGQVTVGVHAPVIAFVATIR